MSTSSQFGSGAIKSLQRVEATLTAVTSLDVTISAVNTAKSELRFLGCYSSSGTIIDSMVSVKLLNSTTLRFTRGGASGVAVSSCEITERY